MEQFSDQLYSKARSVVFTYAAVGLILGGAVGLFLKIGVSNSRDLHSFGSFLMGVPAAIGLWIGYSTGQMKAFGLRLEAQRTLCQLQIEANTRKPEKPQDHDLLRPINIKG
jgi:hypothetical protein